MQPLAERLGLEIHERVDLRERLLSPTPRADWLACLERSFAEPAYALPGGESGCLAQQRVVAVLEAIAVDHAGKTVVAASHGNLIALALARYDESVGFAFWRAMSMPAVFPLELSAPAG